MASINIHVQSDDRVKYIMNMLMLLWCNNCVHVIIVSCTASKTGRLAMFGSAELLQVERRTVTKNDKKEIWITFREPYTTTSSK